MSEKNYNVFNAIKDTIFHPNSCWAEKEVALRRAEICDECPMKTMMNTCLSCGCFIPAKVKYKESRCPQGKW